MKKLLSLSLLGIALFIGGLSSFAQDGATMEQVYQESKKKAYTIASQIDLNEEERQLLVRQITSREQTLAKVEANRKNPNATEDLSKYVAMANNQFKENVATLFGDDRAKKILKLYSIKEE